MRYTTPIHRKGIPIWSFSGGPESDREEHDDLNKKDGAWRTRARKRPAAQTTKAPVLFLQKNWKWLVPVVCVAYCGRCVFARRPRALAPQPASQLSGDQLQSAWGWSPTPWSGTLRLEPCQHLHREISGEGKVLTGEFEEGDVLDEGSILYTLDSPDASAPILKRPRRYAAGNTAQSYDKAGLPVCAPADETRVNSEGRQARGIQRAWGGSPLSATAPKCC